MGEPRRLALAGLWRGGRAGLVVGTMYFLVLGMLVVFAAALGSGTASLPWLVLFVGVGAGCGSVLGMAASVVAGAAIGLSRRHRGRSGVAPTWRDRLVGGLAAGTVVAGLCLLADLTGVPGVLAPEPMTSVLLPAAVAALAGAGLGSRVEPTVRATAPSPRSAATP
jgi:hypothetical protein